MKDIVIEKENPSRIKKEKTKSIEKNNHYENFELEETKENKSFRENDTIKMYLEEISKYNLLSFEEEKELSQKIQEENDEKALNKLINSNLRLVVKIARSYISSGYPYIDIIQDGNMGLIKAARKYDYKKNVRFSTYASWWIKQTIIRNLSMKNRMIKLSHRKEEKLRKIKKAKNRFYQQNKVMPTNKELSVILNISLKEIKEILSVSNDVISIEENVCDEQNFTLQSILGDETYIPDTIIENKILQSETKRIMAQLPPQERMLISLRYGLNEQNEKCTLKKMGELFGISAETARQFELRILNKIKTQFSYLKDFLEK